MCNLLSVALSLLLAVSCVGAYEEPGHAAPRDVHFYSVNLRNVVRWSPGTADARGTTYMVEYAIYGDAVDVEGTEQVVWRLVEQCNDVTQTECDVTEQTNDTEEEYYVRVQANTPNGRSEWSETARRLRLADTILGPPQVNVSVVENKLHVKLSGPFRWRKPGRKRQSMFNIFPHMVYNVSVYSNTSKRTEYFLQPKKLLHHGPLEYNSNYCVRAEVLSLSLHLTNTPSDWICIATPDDPFKSQMLLTMLGGVIPAAICLFVLATVGGFAYYYICGHKPKMPKSVKNIQPDTDIIQMFQPEKPLLINVIIINNTNLSMGESKLGFLGSPLCGGTVPECSTPGALRDTYASQNVQHASAASLEGLQNHRDSLSEDYGLVRREDRNQVTNTSPHNPHALSHHLGGITSYMTQTGATEPPEERYDNEEEGNENEEEQDETQIFCYWDRDTGQLQLDFPLLGRFRSVSLETTEPQTTEETVLLPCRPVLTSVVVKQASMESADDDLLLKMENEWALKIQSTTE